MARTTFSLGYGGQVRCARCHTWWVKLRGRWDDCAGTTSHALSTSTRNTWLQHHSFDIATEILQKY